LATSHAALKPKASGAQAGGGDEQDHRPVDGSELGGQRLELAVGVERAHLAARRLRVVDAGLCRVGVDETPLDGSREGLAQGLGGFGAVSGRERHPLPASYALRVVTEPGRPRGYDLRMPEREPVTVELDVEVAAMLREHAAAGHVSEGEIVERALRAADLRVLVGRIRGRSDLDGDAAMRLVNEELKAVRAERGPRAA
jgi:hypothetical protein